MSNRTNDNFNFDDEDDLFRRSEFDNFENDADLDDNMLNIGDDPIILDEDEPAPAREGTSRTFIILAAVLVLLLVGGFGVLLVALFQQGVGDPALNVTRTAIAERNATTIAQLATIDAQATLSFIATATAMAFTPTPSPTLTPSPTNTPQVDLTATFEAGATATAQLIIARQTQDALNATATALAVGILSPAEAANATATALAAGLITVDAVNQTATALALLFDPIALTAQANANATALAALQPPPGIGVPVQPDQLPDAGLFDDLNTTTMGALAFTALALVGIIAFARRARSRIHL